MKFLRAGNCRECGSHGFREARKREKGGYPVAEAPDELWAAYDAALAAVERLEAQLEALMQEAEARH